MEKSIKLFGKIFRITTVKKVQDEINRNIPMWKVADKYCKGNHRIVNEMYHYKLTN